jgi:hypothetical protein
MAPADETFAMLLLHVRCHDARRTNPRILP